MFHVPLRRVLRALWFLMTVAVIAAVPWTILQFKQSGYSVHYEAWFVAGMFVFLAIPVSIYEIALHLEYFTRPKLQIRIIRILWMVPVYALDSWVALRFSGTEPVLDAVRECYEAYVIYNFYEFLIAYLTDELGDIGAYYSTKQPVPQLWPLAYCVQPWPMGADFFWECKKGVLAYVVVRPLASGLTLLASAAGVYHSNVMSLTNAYVWITLATNLSQAWSLYCLVMMYHGTHNELMPIRPLSKFLCIKAVIFFSYWQGMAINLLVLVGVIHTDPFTTYTSKDLGAGLQNFLICVEMFIAALAHAHAFPPRDYMDTVTWHGPGLTANLRRMFDVRDVVDDVTLVTADTVATTRQGLTQVGMYTLQSAHNTIVTKPKSMLAKLFQRSDKRTALQHEALPSTPCGESAVVGSQPLARALLQYGDDARPCNDDDIEQPDDPDDYLAYRH